jgi:hypothetical protein
MGLGERRQEADGEVGVVRQPILAHKVCALEIVGLDLMQIDEDMEPGIALQNLDCLLGLEDG